MKRIEWDENKNKQLQLERNLSFEAIIVAIEQGNLIDIVPNPNNHRSHQKMLVVEMDNYLVLVPFVEDEEKALLVAFESGKLHSIPNLESEKRRIQNIAKAHGIKNRRVSLRMTEWDFKRIQEEALKEGLPYQSLLSSIIHKYLTGQISNRDR